MKILPGILALALSACTQFPKYSAHPSTVTNRMVSPDEYHRQVMAGPWSKQTQSTTSTGPTFQPATQLTTQKLNRSIFPTNRRGLVHAEVLGGDDTWILQGDDGRIFKAEWWGGQPYHDRGDDVYLTKEYGKGTLINQTTGETSDVWIDEE